MFEIGRQNFFFKLKEFEADRHGVDTLYYSVFLGTVGTSRFWFQEKLFCANMPNTVKV